MASWGNPLSLKGAAGQRGSNYTLLATGTPDDTTAGNLAGDQAFVKDTALLFVRGQSGWDSTAGILLRGAMGVNGLNAYIGFGTSAPTSSDGQGEDGIFFAAGEVYTKTATTDWVDSQFNTVGAKGDDGLRGSQRFLGIGPPPSDPTQYRTPPQVGDEYVDTDPNNPATPTVYYFQ